MRALGFSTDELGQPARELLELLHAQNVRLKIFEHTQDEIIGAMDHAARALRPGSQATLAPPAEFLRDEGWQTSDVEDFIAKLPKKLSALAIDVVAKPSYVKQLGVDENGLGEALRTALPGQREEATRRDVDSLAAIHRLRAGQTCQQLETCSGVFVTTNGALVGAGTRFFRETMGQEQGVSPVIHAHDLTTIVWLKSPTAAPDLPRLQVIADSFAALNPSDELWRKYNDEIARLRRRGDVSTEEFHVLRYSIEARRALLAKTFGDPDVFTEGSVPAILEKARAEITADLRRQVRSERAAKREAQKLAQEAIASERAVRETAEKSVEDLRASLASDKTQREQALTRHAGQIGRFAVTLLLVLVGLVVAFGTFVTSDVLLPRSWKDALPPLEALSVGLVVLLSLASAVFGTSLLSLARGLETHLTPRVARILKTLSS